MTFKKKKRSILIAVAVTILMIIADYRSGKYVACLGFISQLLGVCVNLAVFLMNGYMPVKNILCETDIHKPLIKDSRLVLLSDIFSLGRYVKFSIGDVLLTIGLILVMVGQLI